MQELSISKFKAICLSILEKVRRTGEGVLITRRGEPIAQVLPPPPPGDSKGDLFGCMKGTARELADIVEPLGEEDWEVLKE
jgi:prevent-host-death family protein